MALTVKGLNALNLAKQYFPNSAFTAADLSGKSGEKIYAATLNAVVSNGFMEKLGGSPVEYQLIDDFDDIIKLMDEAMEKGCDNSNLHTAKKVKNDEFYTRIEDVESEVFNYRKQFKQKKVFLNCNDTEDSAFWKYFIGNFDLFDLESLTAISYNKDGGAEKVWTTDGITINRRDLLGTGSFNSEESLSVLDESDIVVTNPPFSVFREYIDILITHKKKFLVIGSQNAYTYKEIFPLIKDNKIWPGINAVHDFHQPDGSIKKFGNICWFTNMINRIRKEPISLTATYYDEVNKREDYPKYDNFNAINVNKIANIPSDYMEVMGVPITFINKYCPDQFEIVGWSRKNDMGMDGGYWECGGSDAEINGKQVYRRILIRRKK